MSGGRERGLRGVHPDDKTSSGNASPRRIGVSSLRQGANPPGRPCHHDLSSCSILSAIVEGERVLFGNSGKKPGLNYAVRTARRAGLTRDLPYGPDDLQWVANSSTLIYGDRDAVLIDTYTSIDQNAELVEWVRSF